MFQYLFVIYPHTFSRFFFQIKKKNLKKKKEIRYPEIEINNCSDGTFSSNEDWPLIHDQAINEFLLFVIIFITITKSNDRVERDESALRND